MRKRIKALIFKITGGHVPIYVQQRALVGVNVTLVTTEDYELMLAELQWRWLRACLLGIGLVTVVGVFSFMAGVRTAWVNEENSFKFMCAEVIEKYFTPAPDKIRNAFEIDYEVADWHFVLPENFKPKGARP